MGSASVLPSARKGGNPAGSRSARRMSSTAPPGSPRAGGQDRVDPLRIEAFGIERATDPLHHVLVLGMRGIADRSEEIGISRNAAAVVGRAGALAADAARHRNARGGREDFFEHDLVLPSVAEIVLVDDGVFFPAEHLVEAETILVFRVQVIEFGIALGNAVVDP